MKRETRLAFAVYLVELAIVAGYVVDWIPVHPIVLMLPLVGLINFKIEGKGRQGLGLVVRKPARSLLLVAAFAALSFGEHAIRLHLEGVPLRLVSFSGVGMESLARDLVVDLFIIALWEEIVSRGYIQTRLQAAWGGWGVLVATLLFATLHLPSALVGDTSSKVSLRFLQTGLSGFLLGTLCWQTGSVLPSILLHGLRNFAGSLAAHLSGLSFGQVAAIQMPFQFLWLSGEVGLMVLAGRFLSFGHDRTSQRQGMSIWGA
ncbi:MAG: CPBP family intramembrane metalloprotease [Anaerolineae bacterium]|jgi:membrane protease YdiL (CAAX protease family)